MLKLAEHAANRLNKSLERVDDSGGDRWSVQHEIHALNIKAISRMDWTVDQRASHILDGVLADPYDLFAGFENTYHELLEESGWRSFYTQARERLDALPPVDIGAEYEAAEHHLRLRNLTLPWYETRDEVGEMIAVMEHTCSSAHDCYTIAKLYLSQADLKNCGSWLAKGDAHQQRGPKATDLHVAYYEASGDMRRAVDAQNSIFLIRPSYGILRELLRLSDLAGIRDQTERAALEVLEQQLQQNRFGAETAAMILAHYHHDLDDLDTAFTLLTRFVTTGHQLLSAIDWYEDEPDRACHLIRIAIEECISEKKKRAYERTAQLLEEVAKPWFDRSGAGAFNSYLITLREDHKPKRSLIGILDSKGLVPA